MELLPTILTNSKDGVCLIGLFSQWILRTRNVPWVYSSLIFLFIILVGKCFDLLLVCILNPFVSSLKTHLKKAERAEYRNINPTGLLEIQGRGTLGKVYFIWCDYFFIIRDNKTKYLWHDFQRAIFEIIASLKNRLTSNNRPLLLQKKKGCPSYCLRKYGN